jgi:hypothetical protein
MERLTELVPVGEHCSKEFVRLIGGGIRWRYVESGALQEALDKLYAYEATGLTPSEVAEVVREGCLAEVRTIQEWAAKDGMVMLDPDGFNRKDPLLMYRKFTQEQYDAGVGVCTMRYRQRRKVEG